MGVELHGPAELVEAAAALLPPVPAALEARLASRGDIRREVRRYRMEPIPQTRGAPCFALTLPDQNLRRGLTRQDLLHAVEADAKLWITSTSRLVVFVHAGVVSWKERALLLPGRSGVGKSTLVQALL
ncbi:MAG: hypothetical protein FIA95_02560, partial [Gemmatimonadetes bacterium]|nr:hypothetical protein [Gemmatimonadota bacterium]